MHLRFGGGLMLSTRHFNKMAEIISRFNEDTHTTIDHFTTQEAIYESFMELIEAFPNPRFDLDRFDKASNLSKETRTAIYGDSQ
jgi:hypothetical protein